MNKILLAITTYNQSHYTRLCFESLREITEDVDVIVIDDASTDDTVDVCREFGISCISKPIGKGLTDSWNIAYDYFKSGEYDYFAIVNNDILIPDGALTELRNVLDKWPCSLTVPMSTIRGVGHTPAQAIDNWYGSQDEYQDPSQYKNIQKFILEAKQRETVANNLYKFDPIRMKMFNGFFFMMNRNICQYERPDGLLFDPEFLNTKNEDEFNWSRLIPNDDYAFLCKTAFVFHYKGVSFTKGGLREITDIKELLEKR